MQKRYIFLGALGAYFTVMTGGRMALLFLYSGMAGGGSELFISVFWLLLSFICFLTFSLQMYFAFRGKFFRKSISLLLFITGISFLFLPLLMYYFSSEPCIGSENVPCLPSIGVFDTISNVLFPDIFLEFFGSSEDLSDYTM